MGLATRRRLIRNAEFLRFAHHWGFTPRASFNREERFLLQPLASRRYTSLILDRSSGIDAWEAVAAPRRGDRAAALDRVCPPCRRCRINSAAPSRRDRLRQILAELRMPGGSKRSTDVGKRTRRTVSPSSPHRERPARLLRRRSPTLITSLGRGPGCRALAGARESAHRSETIR